MQVSPNRKSIEGSFNRWCVMLASPDEFWIRTVFCSSELNGHKGHADLLAGGVVDVVEAMITLAPNTSAVARSGPRGSKVNSARRDEVVGFATQDIAGLQLNLGSNADVIVDDGNAPGLVYPCNRANECRRAGRQPHFRPKQSGRQQQRLLKQQSLVPVLSI